MSVMLYPHSFNDYHSSVSYCKYMIKINWLAKLFFKTLYLFIQKKTKQTNMSIYKNKECSFRPFTIYLDFMINVFVLTQRTIYKYFFKKNLNITVYTFCTVFCKVYFKLSYKLWLCGKLVQKKKHKEVNVTVVFVIKKYIQKREKQLRLRDIF